MLNKILTGLKKTFKPYRKVQITKRPNKPGQAELHFTVEIKHEEDSAEAMKRCIKKMGEFGI